MTRTQQRTLIDQEHLDRLYGMSREHDKHLAEMARILSVHTTQDEERWKAMDTRWEAIQGVLTTLQETAEDNRKLWIRTGAAVIGLLTAISISLIGYVWALR